jgi:hypothetical protein
VSVCLGRSRSPSSSCWIRLVHPPTLLCSDWMVWQLQDPTRVDVLVRNRNCQFAPRLMAKLAVTLSALPPLLPCFHDSLASDGARQGPDNPMEAWHGKHVVGPGAAVCSRRAVLPVRSVDQCVGTV